MKQLQRENVSTKIKYSKIISDINLQKLKE